MGKLLYTLLVGLIGAAIIHIVIVFLVPFVTPQDAWTRMAAKADLYEVVPASGSAPNAVPLAQGSDPFFRTAACRFDLADGIVRLSSAQPVPFWSFSIHDRNGYTTYSLTDRAASKGMLDVVISTPAQMVELRRGMPAGLDQSIFVESTLNQGIVLLRVFMPDDSWTGVLDGFFADLRCEPSS